MFSIKWTQRALDELNTLETSIATRIIKKIDALLENPYSKDIRRLKGEKAFMIRVGDYRVIFEIEQDILRILKVGHRKHIYKR